MTRPFVFVIFVLLVHSSIASPAEIKITEPAITKKSYNQTSADELFRMVIAATKANDINRAARLWILASTYCSYDAMRVAHYSGAAKMAMLQMSTASALESSQAELNQAVASQLAEPEELAKWIALQGQPQYYPSYMLNNIPGQAQASASPQPRALAAGFDSKKTWQDILDRLMLKN